MVENIVVTVMVGLALAGGIFVWWTDSHNNKSDDSKKNVHKGLDKGDE